MSSLICAGSSVCPSRLASMRDRKFIFGIRADLNAGALEVGKSYNGHLSRLQEAGKWTIIGQDKARTGQQLRVHPPLRIFIETTRPLSRSILKTLNFWRGTCKNVGRSGLFRRGSSKLRVTSQCWRSEDNSTSSTLTSEEGRLLNRV